MAILIADGVVANSKGEVLKADHKLRLQTRRPMKTTRAGIGAKGTVGVFFSLNA